MKLIAIKQEEDKFIVPAIKIENSKNGRKIPHPLGNDFIFFKTLDEAKKAIELAGFEYILPNGKTPFQKTYRPLSTGYDEKIIEALLKETNDYNPNIVATAINALSEINNINCLDLYINKMGEDNEKIRGNSIEAIVKFGIKALPEVFNALKSENWVKRNSSIICLQKFCEIEDAPIEKIIDVLLTMLADNNPVVKCSAIEGLGLAYKSFKKSLPSSET